MNEKILFDKKEIEKRISGIESDIEELRGKFRGYDRSQIRDMGKLQGKKEILKWILKQGKIIEKIDPLEEEALEE